MEAFRKNRELLIPISLIIAIVSLAIHLKINFGH